MDAVRGTVASPCIGMCSLDSRGYCHGCLRTGDEIAGWLRMEAGMRADMMDSALPARRLAPGSLAGLLPCAAQLLRARDPLAPLPVGRGWGLGEPRGVP